MQFAYLSNLVHCFGHWQINTYGHTETLRTHCFCSIKVLKYYFVASFLDVRGISFQNAVKFPNRVFNREQVFNSEAPH